MSSLSTEINNIASQSSAVQSSSYVEPHMRYFCNYRWLKGRVSQGVGQHEMHVCVC